MKNAFANLFSVTIESGIKTNSIIKRFNVKEPEESLGLEYLFGDMTQVSIESNQNHSQEHIQIAPL